MSHRIRSRWPARGTPGPWLTGRPRPGPAPSGGGGGGRAGGRAGRRRGTWPAGPPGAREGVADTQRPPTRGEGGSGVGTATPACVPWRKRECREVSRAASGPALAGPRHHPTPSRPVVPFGRRRWQVADTRRRPSPPTLGTGLGPPCPPVGPGTVDGPSQPAEGAAARWARGPGSGRRAPGAREGASAEAGPRPPPRRGARTPLLARLPRDGHEGMEEKTGARGFPLLASRWRPARDSFSRRRT